MSIADLLEAPKGRAEMSAHCRELVSREYTLAVQAKRYLKLYETIIDHATSRHPEADLELLSVK